MASTSTFNRRKEIVYTGVLDIVNIVYDITWHLFSAVSWRVCSVGSALPEISLQARCNLKVAKQQPQAASCNAIFLNININILSILSIPAYNPILTSCGINCSGVLLHSFVRWRISRPHLILQLSIQSTQLG